MDDFERGQEKGRIDALLAEHTAHLARINGNIERFASAVESLTDAMRDGLAELASDIRTLQENSRLVAERLKVTAETLATETERRRAELADQTSTGDRRFSRRTVIVGILIAAGTLAVTAIAVLITYQLGKGP